jgi:hypothetical protein
MSDRRYQMPVNGVTADKLGAKMRAAIKDVEKHFPPRTGICVFTFDFGEGGGMGYISNSERADMHKALREYLDNYDKRA